MKSAQIKRIEVQYFALLREERGLSQETLATRARTLSDLYRDLQKKHKFRLSVDLLRVSLNEEFAAWSAEFKSGDRVVFIPPVTGG